MRANPEGPDESRGPPAVGESHRPDAKTPSSDWAPVQEESAEHQGAESDALPIPLALAPNRMTESLHQVDGSPPLLEDPLIRQGLLDLLAFLP